MTDTAIILATADEDIGKAGPVGLLLILGLLIAVFLLGRSMRTHLRRVPREFPDPQSSATAGGLAAGDKGEVLDGDILDRPSQGKPPGTPPDTSGANSA